MLQDGLPALMFNIMLYHSLASIVMNFLTAVSWERGKTIYLDWLSFLSEHQLWSNSNSQRCASIC